LRSFIRFAAVACLTGGAVAQTAGDTDPNLWLEEVEGIRALAQVRQWNTATASVLEAAPGFAQTRTRALAILNDARQIALPSEIQGDRVTNFWQDAANVRGVWRATGLVAFARGEPEWRTLLSVDALAKAEGRNWVWKGAVCRKPDHARCLVALSDGGKDAREWREFDVASASFVAGGFRTPAAKSDVAWLDKDRILIETDFGPGTLTTSGYGRQVRVWTRGTPLASARLVYEARAEDVEASPTVRYDGGTAYPVITRVVSSWTRDYFHLTPGGAPVRAPLPQSAEIADVHGGRAIVKLNEDWSTGGRRYKAGWVVAYEIAAVLAGRTPPVELVYVPSASEAVEQVSSGGAWLYVKTLDNVAGRLTALQRGEDGFWTGREMPLPRNSVVNLVETGGDTGLAFATVEGLLQPKTLMLVEPAVARPVRPVAAEPAMFDAAKMEATQRFATSADGTRIPYFLVRPKGATGPVPAILHAYGGFRIAQNPEYLSNHPARLGPLAQFWVEEGGAFVLANIRGGDEFGPAWHDSVIRENRQKAFDDFHAVAMDLKKAGIASKIAASGRSNGGLLVGVAMTQRPDLYDAVLMGVPLADMKRYSKLLAGASWMGEYGDPDKREDWAFISKYSPYQALRAGVRYPAAMIYTSTKDDRVHPAHARKMAARLAALGQRFYYYENTQGGHAGSADRTEEAYRVALMKAYLDREMKPARVSAGASSFGGRPRPTGATPAGR